MIGAGHGIGSAEGSRGGGSSLFLTNRLSCPLSPSRPAAQRAAGRECKENSCYVCLGDFVVIKNELCVFLNCSVHRLPYRPHNVFWTSFWFHRTLEGVLPPTTHHPVAPSRSSSCFISPSRQPHGGDAPGMVARHSLSPPRSVSLLPGLELPPGIPTWLDRGG